MKLLYTSFTEDVNEEIAKLVLEGKRILHITPTLILERYRYRKISEILDYKLPKNEEKLEHKVYSFDHWKKVLIDHKHRQRYLSRIEMLVILKRAIQSVVPEQLEWESVAGNLVDLFLTFRSSGMEFYKIQSLSEDESWEVVCKIYQEFLNLTGTDLDPDSCFIRSVKEYPFKEYDELIFDGPFLFFRHLHEAMINRFQELGKKITFIVPYDEDEKIQPAFNIIRKVYSNYVPLSQWEPIGFPIRSKSTYIEEAPYVLFTDDVSFLDSSIEFYQFSSLEQEIMHVVKQILNQVEKKGLKEVAIISPKSKKLRPFVDEVLEQNNIQSQTTEHKVKQLLPMDLIKILYQSKIDWRKIEEETYFDPILFKRILQSNWYNGANRTISSFEKIELFYDQLPTIEVWIDQTLKLIRLYEEIDFSEYRYHPLKSVKKEELELWFLILMELKNFQDELFSIGNATFIEHGNKLLDVIKKLKQRFSQSQNEDPFFEQTQKVIEEQIERFENTALLPITPEEFAGILVGILSNDILLPEQENNIEIQSERKNKPMVTSLHNIAFAEYRFVYLTQFTQENYPSFTPDSWPYDSEIEAKIYSETTRLKVSNGLEMEKLKADCARYYFLLAFLAAKEKVVITFANSSSDQAMYPSPYLMEIARSVGVEVDRKPEDLLKRLKDEGILKQVSGYDAPSYQSEEQTAETTGSIVPDEISLNELALYRLCPKRYHYTVTKPEQNVFASEFHLGFYYGRKISQRAIKLIAEDYKVETTSNNARSRFSDSVIRNYVRQAIHTEREYFPVRKEIEIQAQFLAEIFTKNLINHIFNAKWNKKVEFTTDFTREELEIPFDHRDVKVQMPLGLKLLVGGRPNVYYLDDYELFLSVLEKNEDPEVNSFFEWYNQVRQKKDSREIVMLMNEIVTQPVKRKETKMCMYCPFVHDCREQNDGSGVEPYEAI